MKSTGIVRKVDELGRVVIPIELRRTLGIDEKDALEIYTDNEKIVLKKYEPEAHVHTLERFAYYERAKEAYCVVATGETAQYANIILKKGVVK